MTPESQPRPWWLAVAVILLGLVCLWGASSLPPASRYAGIGPGSFAMIIGGALVILGGLLGVQIWRGERFEPQETENADASGRMNPRAFFYALLAVSLPIVTMKTLGLPFTAMLSFTLVARAFGSKTLVLDIITGAILGSLAWFLFDKLGLQLGAFFPLAGV
ncbi:tripartite tricarboxylate transporter TctB family protein [Paracoccus pacificus]|uniref:Tripartite tricarboxylate transporter TctB family protein n=1 Tax=Paracoccus pacificus TaxID=1463598 RepID=A0ABW4R5F3_9RHOB